MFFLACKCGIEGKTNRTGENRDTDEYFDNSNKFRIDGGKPVNPKISAKYPWLVFLRSRINDDMIEEDFCGGTLVSTHHVISAAHCMFDKEGKLRKEENIEVWKIPVLHK